MKKLLFLSLFVAFLVSSYAQNGAVIFEESYEQTFDEGCGAFHEIGTIKIIETENGSTAIWRGTATELSSGDSVPINATITGHANQNAFTQTVSIVYPSKAIVHTVFHLNVTPNGFHPVFKFKVNCRNESSESSS